MTTKLLGRLLTAGIVMVSAVGCTSKDHQFEYVNAEDLSPEQQELLRRTEAAIARSRGQGAVAQPEMLTQEVLESGQLVDGIPVRVPPQAP